MSWLVSMAAAARLHVGMWGSGLRAALHLAGLYARSLSGGEAGKAALAAELGSSAGQRRVLEFQRAFLPNTLSPTKAITAYDNTGTAFVTRHADVVEVLTREADFTVVYEPRMRILTAGDNFFLGMQDSPDYTRDSTNMRAVVRRGDLARLVGLAAERAGSIVAAAPGRLDVPQDLTRHIPLHLLDRYFGTPGTTQAAMAEWTTVLFWYLFSDLQADPAVGQRAKAASAALRDYLDAAIAARKANPGGADDVLGRCLALQATGQPGMSDLSIRNNLVGLVIGFVPTIAKAATLALAQLIDRPDALATARRAALAGDDATLGAAVFEALRFDPFNPVIYRRAVRDTRIARGTLRSRRIPAGTMVLASNLSAMFDPLAWEDPTSFRTDRPWATYMLWGHGMHICFGDHINRVVIPQILKPLLARPGLRRAPGAAGRIDLADTPFPVHFTVEWEAA